MHNITTEKNTKKELFDFFCNLTVYDYTVVPRYNDHLYNGNLDFRRNFFGNRSFRIKIYDIITEFALSDTDGDFRRQIAFFLDNFYSLKRQKNSCDNCLPAKNFNLP